MTIMNCTFIEVFFRKMFFFGHCLQKWEFHIDHFGTYDRPKNGRSDRTRAKKAIFRGRSTQNGRIDPKWSIRPKMVDQPNDRRVNPTSKGNAFST